MSYKSLQQFSDFMLPLPTLNDANREPLNASNHNQPSTTNTNSINTNPVQKAGTFFYVQKQINILPPPISFADIDLFQIRKTTPSPLSQCPIFGCRRSGKSDSGYFKHWKPTTLGQTHNLRTERLSNGCIVSLDHPATIIDMGFLLRMKHVLVDQRGCDLYQAIPDEHCLYRILSRLRYGTLSPPYPPSNHLSIKHNITTFLARHCSVDSISDGDILRAFGRQFNVTFTVIDSVDGT